MHTNAIPGTWKMCFQPDGGTVIEINGMDLNVIAKPSMVPKVGLAGSITTLTLSAPALVGDWIVMQELG